MLNELPVLILNPHGRCNCRCSMCDIWKNTSTHEFTVDDLERQLDSIKMLKVRWVVLSGGEPLMHSHLWRLTALLRSLNVRITLLSSGLLVGRFAENIVHNVDDMIVSLDGPPGVHDSIRGVAGAFDMLASGVARVHELKPGFDISARCTIQRANFRDVLTTVETAKRLGLASISFLAADTHSAAFGRPNEWPVEKKANVVLGSSEVDALDSLFGELILRRECGAFVRETPEKLRRIVGHFRAQLQQESPVSPECNAPWKSVVIEADGAVRPCFFQPQVGKLGSGQRLDQVLNGLKAMTFRQSLDVSQNAICKQCVCSLNWKQN